MSYILKVGDQNISIPLNEPTELWSHKSFNPELPLVIVITGWSTNFNDPDASALRCNDLLYAAYRCRGNVNYVASISSFLYYRNNFPLI